MAGGIMPGGTTAGIIARRITAAIILAEEITRGATMLWRRTHILGMVDPRRDWSARHAFTVRGTTAVSRITAGRRTGRMLFITSRPAAGIREV